MPVQTTYSINHDALDLGMLVSGRLDDRITLLNGEDKVIRFGKGVTSETGGDKYKKDIGKLPVAETTADMFAGIVKKEHYRATRDGEEFGATAKMDMTVVTEGEIAVLVLEEVLPGDKVFWRVGSEGNGDFCKSAGADDTLAVELPYEFEQGAAAGGIATILLK